MYVLLRWAMQTRASQSESGVGVQPEKEILCGPLTQVAGSDLPEVTSLRQPLPGEPRPESARARLSPPLRPQAACVLALPAVPIETADLLSSCPPSLSPLLEVLTLTLLGREPRRRRRRRQHHGYYPLHLIHQRSHPIHKPPPNHPQHNRSPRQRLHLPPPLTHSHSHRPSPYSNHIERHRHHTHTGGDELHYCDEHRWKWRDVVAPHAYDDRFWCPNIHRLPRAQQNHHHHTLHSSDHYRCSSCAHHRDPPPKRPHGILPPSPRVDNPLSLPMVLGLKISRR